MRLPVLTIIYWSKKMTHILKKSSVGVLLSTSFLLAGCMSGPTFNGADQSRPYEARHPITVEKQETSLEISLDNNGGVLTQGQNAQIKSFIYGYNDKGADNITISVPETGLKAAPARIATKRITEILDGSGIEQSQINIETYMPTAAQSGNIMIAFTKLAAKGPDCTNKWTENLADAYNNTAWKGLGCATRSNLAAMISNPNDLENMRTMGASSSERRIDTQDKYILGQATSAARDDQETARATQ